MSSPTRSATSLGTNPAFPAGSATPAVKNGLTRISPAGGPNWGRVSTEGAAGTTYVTYRNSKTGHRLTIGISNVRLSQGDSHVAYRVSYR